MFPNHKLSFDIEILIVNTVKELSMTVVAGTSQGRTARARARGSCD